MSCVRAVSVIDFSLNILVLLLLLLVRVIVLAWFLILSLLTMAIALMFRSTENEFFLLFLILPICSTLLLNSHLCVSLYTYNEHTININCSSKSSQWPCVTSIEANVFSKRNLGERFSSRLLTTQIYSHRHYYEFVPNAKLSAPYAAHTQTFKWNARKIKIQLLSTFQFLRSLSRIRPHTQNVCTVGRIIWPQYNLK